MTRTRHAIVQATAIAGTGACLAGLAHTAGAPLLLAGLPVAAVWAAAYTATLRSPR